MSNDERSRILHRVQPLRAQLQQSLRGSLADHERLMRALHPLADPPAGDGWNRSELIDLLPPGPPVEAAVLAGIVPRASGAQVILTRRTETLRTHGGQVGFPGGRTEPDDRDALAAALRESQEEIALAPGQVQALGYLDPFVTITGYRVTPVVIDLGGGPLHRRGWRGAAHEAPLKENLAAALLLRAQWPRLHAAGGGLLDPMCGSGTLLIEGALMAADVAPGLMRHGSLPPSRWLGFDKAAWKTLQSEARDREAAGLAALKPVIHGSDIDPTAIQAARENAEVAGVAHAIRFTRADVADLAAPEQEIGAVVCNPPYDERLAADPALYRALGTALQKAVPQWRASLLCGNDELAFATGLRASKKYQMFNGALECALIVCDPIAVPGRDPAQPRELSEGAQMVANRLRKNLKKFKSWRAREHITCFRAYDADLPEYAAAIDVYEEDGGKRRTFLHVQEYAAPAAIPENDVRRRRNELLAAAREVFGVPPEQVSMKSRERGKGGSKYGRFEQRDEFIVVRENNALLQVNLFDYLDTGLFLDHRPLRRMMAEQVRGKRFLNLFCYTGVASVQAAVAGAASTTSVDLSATYLQWCYDNLALNGQGGNQHLLVQADAMAWLEGDRGQYDVIFCDPPTFSNSARADDFDVQREQLKLLRAAVARLAPGGVLYFSNNFRRFKLEENAIAEFAQCREITARTIGPDFERNARIHRAWELKRLG